MQFLYSQWTAASKTDSQRLDSLLSLFSYLLIQSNGDVDEALDWIRLIAERHGIFDQSLTFEELLRQLKERGLVDERDRGLQLTTRGVQKIRLDALQQIFSSLKKSSIGAHDSPFTGKGVDRLSETKKWSFGDLPTDIDLTSTLTNAFKRSGVDEFTLEEGDLEVYETEQTTSCATVLMLDISHSMVLYGEDRITPAKQVALALSELIRMRYPKDYLSLVVFGDEASVVTLNELPFLSAGPYHTNTRAGLQLSRNLLRRCGNVNKQIFMITDGKPSALTMESGKIYKNPYGLDPRIVNKTLDEAVQCRREQIVISTFMIARDPALVNFVEEFTKANHGRAFYSSLQHLGEYLFVDYLRNRRRKQNRPH